MTDWNEEFIGEESDWNEGFIGEGELDEEDRLRLFEDWDEDQLNPPGTIDCGDGWLDDDGVFTEY